MGFKIIKYKDIKYMYYVLMCPIIQLVYSLKFGPVKKIVITKESSSLPLTVLHDPHRPLQSAPMCPRQRSRIHQFRSILVQMLYHLKVHTKGLIIKNMKSK